VFRQKLPKNAPCGRGLCVSSPKQLVTALMTPLLILRAFIQNTSRLKSRAVALINQKITTRFSGCDQRVSKLVSRSSMCRFLGVLLHLCTYEKHSRLLAPSPFSSIVLHFTKKKKQCDLHIWRSGWCCSKSGGLRLHAVRDSRWQRVGY
jgi:hypothetical protein